MRGPTPLYFPVPTKGLVANVPPHQIPPDALAPGSFNVFTDIDGNLKTRLGYFPTGSNFSGLNPKDYPIGLFCYHDAASQQFIIVMQGINTWQYFSGTFWNNITGTNTITGSFDLPARFAVMFQSANSTVFGTNGFNQLFQWVFPNASIASVPAAPATIRDITTIANRLVGVWTGEGGVNYPFRVRWSAINDGTTWPVLAFNDLPEAYTGTDSLVGIKPLNRLNAALYREESIWVMTAQPGTDATAFSFELAPATLGCNGPVCASAIVAYAGLHYYFGTDGRVWVFDGINAYPISDAIDSVVIPLYNPNFLRRTHACYLSAKRQLWFFFPTKTFYTPQPTPWYGAPTVDLNVPSTAAVYDLQRQAFLPLMSYVWDNFTCSSFCDESSALDWSTWVPVGTNWVNVPYSSWSVIPNSNTIGMRVGTENGFVMRWFEGVSDNQHPIAWNATWGLRSAPQLTQQLKVSWIECYLRQIPNALGSSSLTLNEACEADVTGFIQPLDAAPTQITSLAIALSDQSTFFAPVEPGPTNPANLPLNWIQFRIQGQGNPTSTNFFFSGATLYCNVDDKPDYQSVGGIATR